MVTLAKKLIQPEVNIGLVGHVDHGKTTLVKALSGIWTDTHSEELRRGITIRLGYADATFYKCQKCKSYGIKPECKCGGKAVPVRKISFVDAPGHESLMATMLSGATIMDGAVLLVAANEECPQPQTREHLMALNISGIKNVVVVQNKIDTVTKTNAMKNYRQIKAFLKETDFKDAPIIPVSAQQGVNIDVLIGAIEKYIPTPERNPKADPIMFVARSFDINKPGVTPEELVGGVLGGAVKQGILKKGDEIEIKPGLGIEEKNQKKWFPVKTKVIDLKTGGASVDKVSPGGNIGILTSLDPSIVKSDSLAGSVAGLPGKLPPVWYEFVLETKLLERVVGVKQELKVEPIKIHESLMLNINSSATVGIVTSASPKKIKCTLKLPICAEPGSNVTISRMIANRFRLIGYGIIKK